MNQHLALIGFGTVGRALFTQVQQIPGYNIAGIAVKHPEKHRKHISAEMLLDRAEPLIDHREVGVVLEAIDDTEAALAYAKKTLLLGKTYITASKKMVAGNLEVLHRLEAQHGGKLLYEAAVGGAIPVLRTLREHLRSEPIHSVRGIVNGTCNYILTRMFEARIDFDAALAEAQQLGFAESDPSSDIDAHDAYYKSLIIARTLQGATPALSRVVYEGIRDVTAADVAAACKKGLKIKLVAEVSRTGEKYAIDIRPRLIGADDPLYFVGGALNAIAIEGEFSGMLTLQGLGAGGHPTASAMVGDLRNAPKPELSSLKRVLAQWDV